MGGCGVVRTCLSLCSPRPASLCSGQLEALICFVWRCFTCASVCFTFALACFALLWFSFTLLLLALLFFFFFLYHIDSVCFALLCFARLSFLGFTLLLSASLLFSLLCNALPCFASLCLALIPSALRGLVFGSLSFNSTLLCFGSICSCFALCCSGGAPVFRDLSRCFTAPQTNPLPFEPIRVGDCFRFARLASPCDPSSTHFASLFFVSASKPFSTASIALSLRPGARSWTRRDLCIRLASSPRRPPRSPSDYARACALGILRKLRTPRTIELMQSCSPWGVGTWEGGNVEG